MLETQVFNESDYSNAKNVYNPQHENEIKKKNRPEQHKILAQAEKIIRLYELPKTTSAEERHKTLWWIIEQRPEEALDLLIDLTMDHSYALGDEQTPTLLDLAIQRILERMGQQDDSLAAAQRQGAAAYRAHKAAWDQQYAGRYIAVYRGKVIAVATNKHRLLEKIVKQQREQGPFRACIVKTTPPQSGA